MVPAYTTRGTGHPSGWSGLSAVSDVGEDANYARRVSCHVSYCHSEINDNGESFNEAI